MSADAFRRDVKRTGQSASACHRSLQAHRRGHHQLEVGSIRCARPSDTTFWEIPRDGDSKVPGSGGIDS